TLHSIVFTNRTNLFGLMFVGVALALLLIWTDVLSADGAPAPMTAAARAEATPLASLHLLAPGMIGIALQSGPTSSAGLARQQDGTIILGAMAPPESRGDPSDRRGMVLRFNASGSPANPGVTLLADTPMIVSNISAARDGTTIVAGYSNPALSNRHILLARVLPDGLMDSSFGRG